MGSGADKNKTAEAKNRAHRAGGVKFSARSVVIFDYTENPVRSCL